jgi:hypothetical protein
MIGFESGKIPCQKKNIFKLLRKFTENPNFNLSKPWGLRGRDPLLKPEDLAEVAANLDQTGGKTMAREEIRELIHTKHTVRIKAAGFVPIDGVMEASASTTSYYAAILASQPAERSPRRISSARCFVNCLTIRH